MSSTNSNFQPLESSQSYEIEVQVRLDRLGARKVFRSFTVNWSLDESWPTVRDRIRPHLIGMDNIRVDIDDPTAILLKPSTRATLKDFVDLEPDDFSEQLERIYRNIQRGGRLPTNWKFVVVILGSVPVEREQVQRLGSVEAIAACEDQVRAYITERNINMGALEQAYVSRTIAMQDPQNRNIEALLNNPTPTHVQMQRLDALPRLSDEKEEDAGEFIILPVTFNGPVNICLPRKRLLRALGLPEQPLYRVRQHGPNEN
jgi:hypothetical protein